MTLTIDISPDLESRLEEKAARTGEPLAVFVTRLIEESARMDAVTSNTMDHLRAIGVLGAVQGKPRADGRAWSEIEVACDTH